MKRLLKQLWRSMWLQPRQYEHRDSRDWQGQFHQLMRNVRRN